MGVIRGSEAALNTPYGYLSESEYLQISHRAQSTFTEHPDLVYRIFNSYRSQKMGDVIDAADRYPSTSFLWSPYGVDPFSGLQDLCAAEGVFFKTTP